MYQIFEQISARTGFERASYLNVAGIRGEYDDARVG
jgi:hypothetical protein